MLITPSVSISISVLLACWMAVVRSLRELLIHAVPIRAISTSSATTRISTEPRVRRRESAARRGRRRKSLRGKVGVFISYPFRGVQNDECRMQNKEECG